MHFLKNTYKIIATLLLLLTACEAEEPTREDSPEMITTVIVTFTPIDGGDPIIGKAVDPDAEGIRDIETDGPIVLASGTTYMLTLSMYNDLADPDSDEYNISAEVEEEGDEHMLFFGWGGSIFSDPSGNGNIDDRDGVVLYEDTDNMGLPLGLQTKWTTATSSKGTLRIVLKHQPDLKSETSTSDIGESDMDVAFDVNVE
jgi:hypothetical protein